ncbi:hypothetical protein EVJ58_g7536 [Rhodofomes roseus]|uniref:Uncharacterized protein n=1 Tax=Rhodofomes roseus TaxID=34475 RepID=A0A4Y9Y5B4_9APHY|nr:hypothetical protein EVJ58_g7536 [Rhodofomes roseus]
MLPTSATVPIPGQHIDPIPEGPAALPAPPDEPPARLLPRVILYVRETIRTAMNRFHIMREYPRRPSYDPDSVTHPADLLDYNMPHGSDDTPPTATAAAQPMSPPNPFPNMTVYRLMRWLNTGSNAKSLAEADRLVDEVLLADDFEAEQLAHHHPSHEVHKLDRTLPDSGKDGTSLASSLDTSWRETSVTFHVPTGTEANHHSSQLFTVPGTTLRSLVAVMKMAFAEPLAKRFHLTPFKRIWQSISGEQRIYDELYTSDAWLRADEQLQRSPREDGCSLERVIAGLMFWSDSTTLAHFTSAKAWPIYLYFGNLSKYIRGKAGSGACHHVAYIPTLPKNMRDFIKTFRADKKRLLTYCQRELFHAVWRQLLDDEFLQAYKHGVVIRCADGITRRVYPRIFTYSADYPEKYVFLVLYIAALH